MTNKLIIKFLIVFILSFLIVTGNTKSADQVDEIPVKISKKSIPLSFVLTGGINFVNIADLNAFRADVMADYSRPGRTIKWDELNEMYNTNLEIIYNFSSNFGFGLGFGYLFGADNDIQYRWENISDIYSTTFGYSEDKRTFGINAIRLSGNFYAALILSPTYTLNLTAGADYYLAKYKQTRNVEWNWEYLFYNPPFFTQSEGTSEWDEDTSCNKLGFHAGVSFDVNIFSNFAIVISGIYNYVKLDNFNGSYSFASSDGSSKNYTGDLGIHKNTPFIEVRETIEGDYRKAVLDLSGFSIMVGIKYYLSK